MSGKPEKKENWWFWNCKFQLWSSSEQIFTPLSKSNLSVLSATLSVSETERRRRTKCRERLGVQVLLVFFRLRLPHHPLRHQMRLSRRELIKEAERLEAANRQLRKENADYETLFHALAESFAAVFPVRALTFICLFFVPFQNYSNNARAIWILSFQARIVARFVASIRSSAAWIA